MNTCCIGHLSVTNYDLMALCLLQYIGTLNKSHSYDRSALKQCSQHAHANACTRSHTCMQTHSLLVLGMRRRVAKEHWEQKRLEEGCLVFVYPPRGGGGWGGGVYRNHWPSVHVSSFAQTISSEQVCWCSVINNQAECCKVGVYWQ